MFARYYETAELTREDRVQIAVGYGLWTAGVGFQNGCERFGALAIPVGPANADMHCEMMIDMETTVFCSTASMALLMAEEIYKRNLISKNELPRSRAARYQTLTPSHREMRVVRCRFVCTLYLVFQHSCVSLLHYHMHQPC